MLKKKLLKRRVIITPPKKTTSTYYHNKAMGVRSSIKHLDHDIKRLEAERLKLQQRYDALISARDNSERYENKIRSWKK